MDSAEYEVDLKIPAAVIPPAFNNAGVIAIDFEMGREIFEGKDCPNEELKTNGFSPTDIPASLSPPGE